VISCFRGRPQLVPIQRGRSTSLFFSVDRPGRFGYFERVKYLFRVAALLLVAALAPSPLSGQSGSDRLILFGDVVYFYPPGHPRNCLLNNQFKRGEPVGFRMNVTYAGKTVDVPMRDRQNERQPERDFWVAKWMVPEDAPMGIVRYTVTAKDPQGRTGEFKPFEVQASQITIIP
jgi:hypothetical protein